MEKPTVTVVPLTMVSDQEKDIVLDTGGDSETLKWHPSQFDEKWRKKDKKKLKKCRRKYDKHHHRHHPYEQIPLQAPSRFHNVQFTRTPFIRPPYPGIFRRHREPDRHHLGKPVCCFGKRHDITANRDYYSDTDARICGRTWRQQTHDQECTETEFEFDMSAFEAEEISVTIDGEWLHVHGKHDNRADDTVIVAGRFDCEMSVRINVAGMETDGVQGLFGEDGKLIVKFKDTSPEADDNNRDQAIDLSDAEFIEDEST